MTDLDVLLVAGVGREGRGVDSACSCLRLDLFFVNFPDYAPLGVYLTIKRLLYRLMFEARASLFDPAP